MPHLALLAMTSYHCPECGITHTGGCPAADLGDPDREMDKRRICHECRPCSPDVASKEKEGQCAGAPKRKRGASGRELDDDEGQEYSSVKSKKRGSARIPTVVLSETIPEGAEVDLCK